MTGSGTKRLGGTWIHVSALTRLLQVAMLPTGRGYRVAHFLLAWWDGKQCRNLVYRRACALSFFKLPAGKPAGVRCVQFDGALAAGRRSDP